MRFCGRLSECTSHLGEYAANRGLSRMTRILRIRGVWSLKGSLYRAALSGPLRDDTRQEVENLLSACLVTLNRQSMKRDFPDQVSKSEGRS